MLNRMIDLATQASNGTYDNDVDRLNLEKEVVALKEEINRVASSTNFNGIKLLNGSLGAAGKVTTDKGTDAVIAFAEAGGATALDTTGAAIAANATDLKMSIATASAANATTSVTIGAELTIDLGKDSKYNDYTVNFTFTQGSGASAATVSDENKTITIAIENSDLAGNMDTATKVADAAQAELRKLSGLTSATVSAGSNGSDSTSITSAGGSFASAKVAGGVAATDKVVTVTDATKSWTTNITAAQHTAGGTFTLKADDAADGTMSITLNGDAAATDTEIATVTAATSAVTTIDFTGKTGAEAIGTTIEIGGTKYEFVKTAGDEADGNTGIVLADDADADAIATALQTAIDTNVAGHTATAAAGKVVLTSDATGTAAAAAEVTLTGAGLRLQIGDTADQAVSVAVGDMSATALGLDGVSVASEKGAADSIALIKSAINTVSGTRADLGAIQNRLEHTVNNLTTTTENMTNAESRIRDTDMAKEMMAFTKNNVLAQAAQSMLAQANQQPQQVLQLLR